MRTNERVLSRLHLCIFWTSVIGLNTMAAMHRFLSVFDNVFCDFFLWRNNFYLARASSLSRLHDHTETRHTRWGSSGLLISPIPDNTQYVQETDILVSGEIRTRKRAAAHAHVRPHGHFDRYTLWYRESHLGNRNRFKLSNRCLLKVAYYWWWWWWWSYEGRTESHEQQFFVK